MTYMLKQRHTTNKRALGSYYEEIAAAYLDKHGYQILEHNFRCRCGEIDLIAAKDEYIIFIEVKYRKNTAFGYPREAVTFTKRQHIYHTAQYYLLMKYGYEKACRFDIIEILEDKLTHIKAAF